MLVMTTNWYFGTLGVSWKAKAVAFRPKVRGGHRLTLPIISHDRVNPDFRTSNAWFGPKGLSFYILLNSPPPPLTMPRSRKNQNGKFAKNALSWVNWLLCVHWTLPAIWTHQRQSKYQKLWAPPLHPQNSCWPLPCFIKNKALNRLTAALNPTFLTSSFYHIWRTLWKFDFKLGGSFHPVASCVSSPICNRTRIVQHNLTVVND